MIKTIIFDFDGVIAESVDLKTKAFAKLFEPYGWETVNSIVEYHLNNTGVSRFDKFRHIYGEILKEDLNEDLFTELCSKFAKLVVDEVVAAPFVPGVQFFLQRYSKEFKCFVLSATPQDEIEEILKRKGISGYFFGIYGSPREKSDVVKEIIEKENLFPGEAAYVGDSLSDYNAARENGINFVARVMANSRIFENIDCPKARDLNNLYSIINGLTRGSELVLGFPLSDLDKIKRSFKDEKEVPWIYLGKNFIVKKSIANRLGAEFKSINISGFQEEAANDIRRDYVEWTDELNRAHGEKAEWWFGSLASRDIYKSNLFQYACYLSVIEKMFRKDKGSPGLIILESSGLAKTIINWANNKGIKVTVISSWRQVFKNYILHLIPYLQSARFLLIATLRASAAKVSILKYGQKNIIIDDAVVIDTFIHDSSLSSEGVFCDRYYPYLHEYLRDKSKPVLVHPVLYGFGFSYFSIYPRMRKSQVNFIIQEDFLKLNDYLYALSFPFKSVFKTVIPGKLRGFDFVDVVREELNTLMSISSLEACLIYRLFLHLARKGFKPRLIIDWYENQPIDKALILAVRQAIPEAKIAGAQLFIHSSNWLNYYPSQSEVEAKVTPHLLIETSRHQCKVVQTFTKAIPCKQAAALRNDYLFNKQKSNIFFSRRQDITVILSANIQEAAELLDTIKESLPGIKENIKILIKAHPDYEVETLIRVFGREHWSSQFEIFPGSFFEALSRARFVISANSSSMIEVVAFGIPLIFLGSQMTLNQDMLSDLDTDMVSKCYSPGELVSAINRFIDLPLDKIGEYSQSGNKIRDLFFEPVNERTLSAFIN